MDYNFKTLTWKNSDGKELEAVLEEGKAELMKQSMIERGVEVQISRLPIVALGKQNMGMFCPLI